MNRSKQLEKIIKGVSNHHRIDILFLLAQKPGLSLLQISQELMLNMKTVSEHTYRLNVAGLIKKRYKGREVLHTPTSLGQFVLTFLRKLE